MVRRRKVVNFGLLVVLVAAGIYFLSRYWSQAAGSLPAAVVLSASGGGHASAGGSAARGAAATADRGAGATVSPARSGATTAAGALASAKLRQQSAESRELAQLRAVAQDASANATVRAQASEEIVQLERWQAAESLAEVVLAAKGYPDAVVILRTGGATVLVPKGRFGAPQAALVAQTVASVAGLDPSAIQIVPTG